MLSIWIHRHVLASIETTRKTERERDNSNVKIRSHQRFITPPEGGSFRQLTSTRRKREMHTEQRNTNREGRRQQSTQRERLSGNLALAHFLIE